MSHTVVVPQMGESITEGILSRWLVADGAVVTDSTPLFELETDKITTEVQSGAAGVVRQLVKAGEPVQIGAAVASIDAAGQVPVPTAPVAPAVSVSAGHVQALSPAVKKLVADTGVDPASIPGSGKDGRLTKGDVLAATQKPAVPAPAPSVPPAPTPASSSQQPAASSRDGAKRRRMSPLRQRIAQRLVQAQHTAAILTTFNEIDMGAAMALRKKWKEPFEKQHGVGLGFMSLFSVAAVKALQKYPLINAQIDGTDIVESDGVHLGIAVGTEKGLVVPVLRHAERLSLADVERTIKEAATRARDGKLALEDLQGGTFTITNGGVYGSLMSTPIINPPQSGILGLHAIKDRPVALDGQVVIRPMMYVALSYDHRIVDGSEAVGFLVRVKELIEAPERLLLGL